MYFKPDSQLSQEQIDRQDVWLAQLHYTMLWHLARVYEIFNGKDTQPREILNQIIEGFSRLVSAQDCAFTILQRYDFYNNPQGKYISFDIASKHQDIWVYNYNNRSKKWKDIENIRALRNDMVHGSLPPWILDGEAIEIPMFDHIANRRQSRDWRVLHRSADEKEVVKFAPAKKELKRAWDITIEYFEEKWKEVIVKYLEIIPSIQDQIQAPPEQPTNAYLKFFNPDVEDQESEKSEIKDGTASGTSCKLKAT